MNLNNNMKIKIYEYSKCSTCVKALKFLDAQAVTYTKLNITETPPTQSELKTMLGYLQASGGSLKNLFNTSGIQYRELKIADKLKAGMSESEALKLLSQNGRLIKRPFILTSENGAVGFKAEVWKKLI